MGDQGTGGSHHKSRRHGDLCKESAELPIEFAHIMIAVGMPEAVRAAPGLFRQVQGRSLGRKGVIHHHLGIPLGEDVGPARSAHPGEHGGNLHGEREREAQGLPGGKGFGQPDLAFRVHDPEHTSGHFRRTGKATARAVGKGDHGASGGCVDPEFGDGDPAEIFRSGPVDAEVSPLCGLPGEDGVLPIGVGVEVHPHKGQGVRRSVGIDHLLPGSEGMVRGVQRHPQGGGEIGLPGQRQPEHDHASHSLLESGT